MAIPIIIHLLNRRTAKVVKWGAMRFLLESMASRRRRIELEEALLMAARCLLFALLALAVARPFIPPGSSVPWVVVLPLGLLAVVALGVGVALWSRPKWRWLLILGGVGALLLCGAAVLFEKHFNLRRLGAGEKLDVALVIDGSASMTLEVGGESNFERAVAEAREIIERSGGGDAFSITVAGPVPVGVVPTPVSSRADLYDALEAIEPVNGSMAAFDALTFASLGLAQGYHPNKQIIVITDGQSLGWERDSTARWESFKSGLESLPTAPQVIVRELALPVRVRNAAVAGLSFSREVIGTDRPVTVEVTVENTGSEAVTPSGVELRIGGETFTDKTLGQLMPGTREVVRFEHHFKVSGGYEAEARVLVEDEIETDNSMPSAVNVVGKLKVLLVDGSPSRKFFERSTAFTSLALAPGLLKAEGEGGKTFLVEPEVVDAGKLAGLGMLASYNVVVLADVPKLPSDIARVLAQYVAGGGGLLVAPGERVETGFYNQWVSPDGEYVLPGALMEAVVLSGEGGGVAAASPSGASFSHPALALLGDVKRSDFTTSSLQSYWRIGGGDEPVAGVSIGGRLDSGDVFVSERRLGSGAVVLLACSLDNRGGNLVTRQSFVPFVHEMIYYLSRPSGAGLNLEPSWEMALDLSANGGAVVGGNGLHGQYFRGAKFGTAALSRVDPTIDFDWGGGAPGEGLPGDGFSVRWTGTLTPSYSEEYEFSADVDDELRLWIGGKEVIKGRGGGRIELEAKKGYPLRAEYKEFGAQAKVRLFWRSKREPWGPVRPMALSPTAAGAGDEGERIDTFVVQAPDGGRREAEVVFAGGRAGGEDQWEFCPGAVPGRGPRGSAAWVRAVGDDRWCYSIHGQAGPCGKPDRGIGGR